MRMLCILTAGLLMSPVPGAPQSPDRGSEDRGTPPEWSVAGEMRLQYERFANEEWGAAPEDANGYLLQRYIFSVQRRVSAHVAVLAEVKSGIEAGRKGGPRLPDEDRFDIH